jgi:hypothetical protein
MYYRITTFTFDADREDEVMAIAHAATDKLTAIVGIQSAVIVRVSPGKTITIASYDTQESAATAQPQIQAILGQLTSLLTAPPEVQEGPVLLDFF